jgi:3-oxoacyl-[acyl-carrier protein] reductase
MPLERRVAVVTGGSSGIGLGIVRRLIEEGARVAFCGTDAKRVAAALAACNAGGRALGNVADVADPAAVQAFLALVRARFGDPDILVNNAGISPKRQPHRTWLEQVEIEEWRRVIDVNLTGAWLCSRAACPAMIARGWGRIVNIGSIAGRTMPKIAGPHYAAAKAGLAGLTRSLAYELAPNGVTVNCIAPAWVESSMTTAAGSKAAIEASASIPVRRIGRPSDVAAAVAFLSSTETGYITGTTLDVNGGMFAA